MTHAPNPYGGPVTCVRCRGHVTFTVDATCARCRDKDRKESKKKHEKEDR